jgi:glucose-1-phosphate thymidylyltransferase
VTTTAVILARGLGTRMRAASATTLADTEQTRVADSGVKALIPVGRPFLDYVLSALADAGVEDVILVVGPEHDALRERYEREARPSRLRVGFAVQAQPRGTADAVLAAEAAVHGRPFLVINSDNYYPVEALRLAAALPPPGLVAFDRDALVGDGHIEPERALRYALLRVDEAGHLEAIVEKPSPEDAARFGARPLVSMTLWAFDARIFGACRRVTPSVRGELELPEAVAIATREGMVFGVARCALPVLDLSSRADIAPVAERLRGVEVSL